MVLFGNTLRGAPLDFKRREHRKSPAQHYIAVAAAGAEATGPSCPRRGSIRRTVHRLYIAAKRRAGRGRQAESLSLAKSARDSVRGGKAGDRRERHQRRGTTRSPIRTKPLRIAGEAETTMSDAGSMDETKPRCGG